MAVKAWTTSIAMPPLPTTATRREGEEDRRRRPRTLDLSRTVWMKGEDVQEA